MQERYVGKRPYNVWWTDVVKDAVERKDSARKDVLGARDEVAKDRCIEVYKEEKRKVKRCIYHNKKEANEHLEGRRIEM